MLKYFLIKFKHVNLQVSTPHLGVSSLLKMPWEPHTGTGHGFLQLRRGRWEMWPAPHSSTYTRSPTFLSSFFHSQRRNGKSSCHREKSLGTRGFWTKPRNSCHKGNDCGNLRVSDGRGWHVDDWRRPIKASTLLTLLSTTRTSSEVRTAEWRGEGSDKRRIPDVESGPPSVGWQEMRARQCFCWLVVVGAGFLVLGLGFAVSLFHEGVYTCMSFLLPWVVFTGSQGAFPRSCFGKELRIVHLDLLFLIIKWQRQDNISLLFIFCSLESETSLLPEWMQVKTYSSDWDLE